MSGQGGRGFVRLHDAWFTDDRLQALIAAGRHDALALYFGMIGWCHLHDTDGYLSVTALRSVRSATGARSDAARTLLRVGAIVFHPGSDRASPVYEVCAYRKWQTTSDQRKDNTERMRTSRARANGRASKREREIERENARARDARADSASSDPEGPLSLSDAAQRELVELRRRRGTRDA